MKRVTSYELRVTSGKRRMARREARPGIALVTVLIVLVILGLVAGGFVMNMRAEDAGQRFFEQQVQAKAACDAGQTVALAMARKNRLDPTKWLNNETLFRDIPLQTASTSVQWQPQDLKIGDNADAELTGLPVWRYSIIRPDPEDDTRPIFGLIDEGGKFNLNSFTQEKTREYKRALLRLPNVTEEMADSLLDWLDENADPGQSGAEESYYSSLSPPYAPANGPLHSIDELLMVKGWTPKLLYGEDVNHNGILDPSEDDGDKTDPPDDGNGVLDRGLYPFLTIWSVEANLANDNKARTPLQTPPGLAKLKELYDEEKAGYLTKLVQLGVQFRSPADLLGGQGLVRKAPTSQPRAGNGNQRSASQPANQASGDQTNQKDAGDKADTDATEDSASSNSRGSANERYIRGRRRGIASSQPGNGSSAQQEPIPASPFTAQDLPVLMDKFTTVLVTEQTGLINVNTAPEEVLQTIPGVDATVAQAMVNGRKNLSAEDSATTAWLLTNNIAPSLEAFQQMAPYITSRATVFDIDAVGYCFQSNVQFRRKTIMQVQGGILRPLHVEEFTGLPTVDFVGLKQKSGN